MGTRKCRVCGESKDLSEFGFRNKKRGWYCTACKECVKNYYRTYRKSHIDTIRESARKYVNSHREQHNAYNRQWNIDNLDRKREWRRKRMLDKEYRNKVNEARRARYQKAMSNDIAREKRNTYARNAERKRRLDPEYKTRKTKQTINYRNKRIKKDPVFKATVRIRNLIRTSLLNQGYTKKSKTYTIVGCSYDTLWEHLKRTWKKNYGTEWNGESYHIDHVIPLATAKTEEEIIKLCHYTNLQLLTPFDNMSKHDKVTTPSKQG